MGEQALNCISWGLVPWERTDVQGPLWVPRVHITSQNKPLHGSVSPVGAQPPPWTSKNPSSHLPAPHHVPGGCGSAEHIPTQLPQSFESVKPNKSPSSWVWPGPSGFKGTGDSWGSWYKLHCWRAEHGPWEALGPSQGNQAPSAPNKVRRATPWWDHPAFC